MEQIRKTALRQQDSSRKTTKTSVPAGLANVKNPLRRLRLMTGLPSSTLVRTVREMYPRYDKYLQSKCERTEEYGVTLCKEALDTLIAAYAPGMDRKPPRTENRARPCKGVLPAHGSGLRAVATANTGTWLWDGAGIYASAADPPDQAVGEKP